ncbi:MAG: hypothetical protein ACNA78_01935 [Balneolaceae bacterium]
MTNRPLAKSIYPLHHTNKKQIPVFIAGTGAVGNTLIRQFREVQTGSHWVAGICNSKRVFWYASPAQNISQRDLNRGVPRNWESVVRELAGFEAAPVFVDATGAQEVADLYPQLLKSGIHVVTASKLANSGSQAHFRTLASLSQSNGAHFLYETNVGAGLPIIGAIQQLTASNDTILSIRGVLSGTMTYLFSELDAGVPFSKAVLKARQLGYAEPDPRDDLSGEDVARKMMILARTAGLIVERDQVEVENLTPEPLRDADSTRFLDTLSDYDNEWRERLDTLKERGQTLRYIGELEGGTIRVGLREVDLNSPFGRLSGTNNLVVIRSRRYNDQPLIIQGPGAGKEVTAAGLMADIMNIQP